MDARFHNAITALRAADLEKFKKVITDDSSLATTRSSRGHPTLLQCVALDGNDKPNNVEMARVLVEAGAEIDEPLIACASINNHAVATLLLDYGAAIDGNGDWSPLEEALYWNNSEVTALLLQRGAKVQNLRIAAGLGRTDLIENYFNSDGSLKPEAGTVNWPWRGLGAIQRSSLNEAVKQELLARINSWSQDRQGIINNAFIYACMRGHTDAAKLLLLKGAEINVIPDGFDYAGTGLHYAALNGQRAMVDFLLDNGADPNVKDTKVGSNAAGWADYGGHAEVRDLLLSKAQS